MSSSLSCSKSIEGNEAGLGVGEGRNSLLCISIGSESSCFSVEK